MNERERKEIINKINTSISKKESLNEKYAELQELIKNPIVMQYLNLQKDIKSIEEDINRYHSIVTGITNDSLEERIKREFKYSYCSCEHSIWLYDGSYYLLKDPYKEHDCYGKEYSETIPEKDHLNYSFDHNRYLCLECHTEIKTSDWESFESKHFVLKNQDQKNNKDADYYKNKYYQLLYTTEIEKSQKIIIDEFLKDKEKNKVLLKTY